MLRRQGSKINIVAELAEENEPNRERARPDTPSMFTRRSRRVEQRKFQIETSTAVSSIGPIGL